MHTNVQNPVLTMAELRQLALDCGADDAGGVSLDQPELAEVRQEAAACFPAARCALSLVGRMNREPIRSPARSLANAEFHDASEHLQGAARELACRVASASAAEGETLVQTDGVWFRAPPRRNATGGKRAKKAPRR